MSNMLQKTYKNTSLGVEITSFIDKQQIIWFLGKDVAKLLGYKDTNQAIRKHVDNEDQKSLPVNFCEFCTKVFCSKNTLATHLKVFHRIVKNI